MSERAHHRPAALLLLTALLIAACRKEPERPQWDVDVALPLIRTTLTIGDLIGDTLVGTDGQGNVSIVYSARLFELQLDTLLHAPDTTFRYKYPEFDIPEGSSFSFNPGTPFASEDQVTRFDLDQFELRELRVRSGQLDLSFTNRVASVLTGSFMLPGTDLNGAPLLYQPSIPAGSPGTPALLSQSFALDGYRFDLRGPGFNDVNTLAMQLQLQNQSAVSVGSADSLEAFLGYHDIVPEYARGYFGQRVIELDADTSELNAFDGMSGILDIDEANAVLVVRNGVGVDARANVHYIRSVNTSTGNVVDLQHVITSSPLNLDRALDLGNGFQAATNSYMLNTANSNLDAFIENLPHAIAYDMDVTIDPLGDVSNGNDFLYHESSLTADLDVEIPLNISATDLTLSRKTTIDLEGTLEHHALQYGTLHFFATNRFPFSAAVELDMVSADGVVLGELAPGGTIASASLGQNGWVTSGTTTQIDFAISKEQLDLFYPSSTGANDGARLRIKVAFNTVGQPDHVQLRSNYRIDLLATLEGNYIVNGNE